MIKNHTFSKLRVLAYHKVKDINLFETQLRFINSEYTVIGLEELENYFINGDKLPPKPLLITFDDGDLSVYEKAFPLLKRYNFPAILFVITSLIGTNKPFWWDEIEYYLGNIQGNKKVWEVKTWPNKKREDFLKKLRQNNEKGLLRYQQLTVAQLQEMKESNFVIANHSHSHPMFNNCNEDELKLELQKSQKILSDLNFSPNLFAYPNGNYSLLAENILHKSGTQFSFLFDHKINNRDLNSLRISRLVVNDTTPLWKFKLILSGWHTQILPITKRIGKIYRKIK